jgi:hypothetical protein
MDYSTKFVVGGAAVAFLAVAYVAGGKTEQPPHTVPVALATGPTAAAGRDPPSASLAQDGCDLAGAIPKCKEEMAKLMASRPIMSSNNRTPEAVSRNVQTAQEADMWQAMRAKTDSIARACGGHSADDIETIARKQAGRNCIDAHTGSMFGTD